jgi:16S rRNA (adenine1518-N6/adenine1519-N6)-dimethyltransferase
MGTVKPKKFLGQHFLKDLRIAEQIADTLDAFPAVPVIEVGPGMGVLTQFLLSKDKELTVIEIDRDSVPYLNERFPDLRGRIIEGDFLQLDLTGIYPERFCVIGNYPYNISSQIFFKVLEYREHIPCCSGMLQKEVAERITSVPGSKAYGILSVLLQAWYNVEYLFTVSETVFDPPPKVKSAVIRLTRNGRQNLGCDEKLFKTVVKTSFNQRRKTLRNSMKPILGKGNEIYSDEIFNKRPEQLSVEDFVYLTELTEKYMPKVLENACAGLKEQD